MPLTITHPFVSAKADNPTAAAAGKVLPSQWDAAHNVAGNLQANEITNIPFGIVTGTDVQAAINELEAAIPAPGPGTDPLFLTKGLGITVTDPAIDANTFNRYAEHIVVNTDVANVDPSFANSQCVEFIMNVLNGQNNYNILTQAKESFFGTAIVLNGIGSGQRFAYNNTVNGYGMGDIAIHGNDSVVFAGGPVAGDEGQGWGLVSQLHQQNFLSQTTISSVPAKSLVNTTTTQVITKSMNLQTVSVVSTVGAINGDWIVVDQELPTDASNMEAVQIVSFTANSITGVFRCNHNNGCTITPALLLNLASNFTLGQDRVLVNWSQPSYSVGTIASITGGGFTGAGTNWTTNMVGGYALNIGAITLPVDNYPSTPFNALNPLKSVYQIKSLVNPALLSIMSTTVAGDASYRGKGPGPSGAGGSGVYSIHPCAKILRIDSTTGVVICETSTSTWSIGDSIEQVFCPYPDVSGFQYNMAVYTNGSTCRSFMHVLNSGSRTFDTFLNLEGRGNIILPGGDGVEWGTIFEFTCRCNIILDAVQAINTVAGIRLPSAAAGLGATDAGGSITWPTGSIVPNSANLGLDIFVQNGLLQLAGPNTPINPISDLAVDAFKGYIRLTNTGAVSRGMVEIDRDVTDFTNTNFTKGTLRWNSINFPLDFGIVTTFGGAGQAADITLKPNNVEAFRCIAGGTVQFSAAASFSANGGVATSLTGVGPAGSNTTVQKWLTIKDDGGITRYIPCF